MIYCRAMVALCAALCVSSALADGLPAEVPDPLLTPGVVATLDEADVCGVVDGLTYSKRHRQTPAGLKKLVFERYGIDPQIARTQDWEIDHRGPLALGFADVVYNLWAQPGNDLGVVWTYHEKDALERVVWEQVCKRHSISLGEGQAFFMSADWRIPYCALIEDDERCTGMFYGMGQPLCWSKPETPGSCPVQPVSAPFGLRAPRP